MTDERRAHKRVDFSGKAFLTYDGRCRQEDVIDVSSEGIFLRSRARLSLGKMVKVFLPIPVNDSFRLCLLKGEVVRRGAKGRGGLGIALSAGELDTRAMLQHYVSACA